MATRAGVTAEAAAETLAALEREGLLEAMPEGAYRAARLDSREVRELYPAVLLLEALAVRDAPGFDPEALDGLRAANDALKETDARSRRRGPTTASTAASAPAATTRGCSPCWTRCGGRCCPTSACTWARPSGARGRPLPSYRPFPLPTPDGRSS